MNLSATRSSNEITIVKQIYRGCTEPILILD